MTRTIVLTGASGTVSRAVATELAADDAVHVRLLNRGHVPASTFGETTSAVAGDLDDPRSLLSAFEGADSVWLVTPNSPRAPENHSNALWAARQVGVEQIVRLSAIGAAVDAPTRSGRLHALSELELRETDLQWTILRPMWFMQNLLNQAPTIAAGNPLQLNFAGARVGMIDVRDIAACAARILTTPAVEHHGRTYTLTGPRSVGLDVVGKALSHELGRPVGYVPLDDVQQRDQLLGFGVDPWIVDMLEEYAHAFITGWADYTTTTVAELTGIPPRDVQTFINDYRAAFAG